MVLGGRKWFQVVSGCFTWFGFGWFRMVCCLSNYGLRNGLMEFSRVAFLNRCCIYIYYVYIYIYVYYIYIYIIYILYIYIYIL